MFVFSVSREGNMANTVDVGQCVSFGIDSLKKHFSFQVLSGVIISFCVGSSFGLLYGPLYVGYYRAMAKIDAGETPEVGDLFSGFDQFLPSLIVSLLVGTAIWIGFLMCVIPGLLLLPLSPVSLCVVARGEKDGIAAVKAGWRTLTPNLLMAALTVFVLSMLASLGMIGCFVGIFLTLPILNAGQYKMGQQMLS